MNNALKISSVSKKYDGFVLDNVNLTLPKGCIMGLIGENGAGKSTTIKLILDLITRDSGEIEVLGQDNRTNFTAIKQDIGVVMDECCFPEILKTKDVNRIMKNIYQNWDQAVFQSYIERFSLPERKMIKDYSQGMRMKLTIAVALSHHAKLLLLDEATSGLDPIIRDEILDVFLEFIQNEEHSILISSHIISDLEKICDYITFIHKGQIVFSEPKDELLDSYRILKCSEQEFAGIPASAVKACQRNQFGIKALVHSAGIKNGFVLERAGIEDIMLYYIKEERV